MDPVVVGFIIYGIVSGVTGMITAYAGIRTARTKADEDCQQKLAEARKEAEEAHAELHKLRMQK